MIIPATTSHAATPSIWAREAPRARVLVVSYEPAVTRSLRRLLLLRGHAVGIAHDRDAARSLAARDLYDLIVLDLTASELEGLTLCRALRAGDPAIAILAMHAAGTLDDLIAGFESGANAYIRGSVAAPVLLAQIHALLRRHRIAQSPTGSPTSGSDASHMAAAHRSGAAPHPTPAQPAGLHRATLATSRMPAAVPRAS